MLTIRAARQTDLPVIQDISRVTFFETFSEFNTSSDMQKYMNLAYSDNQLRSEMNNPNSLFYLAFVDDVTVGYLKVNISDAQTEDYGDEYLEIQRIYVKQDFQKMGVGNELMKVALKIAQNKNKARIWLGVWLDNIVAKNFYLKLGFKKITTHTFVLGSMEQQDDIMMKEVNNG